MVNCENPKEFQKELLELMEKHGVVEIEFTDGRYDMKPQMVFWDCCKRVIGFEGTRISRRILKEKDGTKSLIEIK